MNKETAQNYMDALTRFFTAKYKDAPRFSLFPHTHEDLPEGYWVITAEGWYDKHGRLWTSCLPLTEEMPLYLRKLNAEYDVLLTCSISVRDKD